MTLSILNHKFVYVKVVSCQDISRITKIMPIASSKRRIHPDNSYEVDEVSTDIFLMFTRCLLHVSASRVHHLSGVHVSSKIRLMEPSRPSDNCIELSQKVTNVNKYPTRSGGSIVLLDSYHWWKDFALFRDSSPRQQKSHKKSHRLTLSLKRNKPLICNDDQVTCYCITF